jgi:hypothetical protein
MGSAPYIGSKLGGGPIFQVSVSQLDAKERPWQVKYPRDLHNSNSSHCYYRFQPYASTVTNRAERGQPAIEPIPHCVPLTAAVLSGHGHDRSFALKCGIRRTRLSSVAVGQVTYTCISIF